MTEMSVVLPQPEGPTSIMSSPFLTSRSTPRSAMTFASSVPYVFTTFVQLTASSWLTCLPLEYDSRLELHHFSYAYERGEYADERHRRAAYYQKLPRELE